jgi:hypothetical protein
VLQPPASHQQPAQQPPPQPPAHTLASRPPQKVTLELGDEPAPASAAAAAAPSQAQQLQEVEQEVQRLSAHQKQVMAKYGRAKVSV